MPEAVNAKGSEIFPIVQDSKTRKARAIFIGPDNKIIVPNGVTLAAIADGTEINLLSAKIVDGRPVIYVGNEDSDLNKGMSKIVTEEIKKDGKAYVRINNSWIEKNPITQINTKTPLTGGGSVTLTARDVGAHKENTNTDGLAYVSRNGEWISLNSSQGAILATKADKVHKHTIPDIDTLESILTRIEQKADNYAHKPAYVSVIKTNYTTSENGGFVPFDKQIIQDIDYTTDALTFTRTGNYLIAMSGESNGKLIAQMNGVDIPGLTGNASFSKQNIVGIPENGVLKIRYETVSGLNASFVLTAHKM